MKQSVIGRYFKKIIAIFEYANNTEMHDISGNMYQQIACQRWEHTLNKINLTNDAVTTTQLSFTL